MIGAKLEAWAYDPGRDLGDVLRVAAERAAPPAFAGHLLATRGDALTLQLADGAESARAGGLYYVLGHGAFVLGRREEWPARAAGGSRRVLVTLLAFPRPEAEAAARHP